MRGGILLAEEAPLSLMERCGCADLEEAFLMLSHKQEQDTKSMVSQYLPIFIFELRYRSCLPTVGRQVVPHSLFSFYKQ